MQLVGSIAELTSEDDNLANDELGDAARVGEGRVENSDTMTCGVIEIDLVSTDAKAANDEQVLGLAENALAQLSFGANSNNMDVTEEKYVSILSEFAARSASSRGRSRRGAREEKKNMAGYFLYLPDLLNKLVFGQ